MTEQVSEYSHLQQDDLQDYVERMQDMVTKMIEIFYFEHKKIDELNFKRLSLETFEGTTINEAAQHFRRIVNDFKECCRLHLISRIEKGEKFLESIEENDHRYEAAQKKLVSLINELARYGE